MLGIKENGAAAYTRVLTFCFAGVVFARKRPFRTVLTAHVVLLRCECFAPFVVGFFHFFSVVHWVSFIGCERGLSLHGHRRPVGQ